MHLSSELVSILQVLLGSYSRKFSAVLGTRSLYRENTMRPAGFLPILISKYVIGLCKAMSIAEEKIARCQTFIYYLLLSSLYISLDKLRNSSESAGKWEKYTALVSLCSWRKYSLCCVRLPSRLKVSPRKLLSWLHADMLQNWYTGVPARGHMTKHHAPLYIHE